MNIFEQNRERARQVFLNSPYEAIGDVPTGNTGEVKFAVLPQVDEEGDDYLIAQWVELCYRAGPGADWLEYRKKLSFYFRGQPLKLFAAESTQDEYEEMNGFNGGLGFFIESSESYQYDEVPKSNQCEESLGNSWLSWLKVLIFGQGERTTPESTSITHQSNISMSKYYRLEEEPLPSAKQSGQIWAIKFYSYHSHHFGSLTAYYDMTIDLENMEVRYLRTTEFDAD
ncbi:MAG: hypothetical protein NW224_18395 [Leptolyngbyaceae cyanobacterium bins.302]|nr:hypothetical protein [Leptolyngbyaceae cyanobacterium bins.302]